MTTTEPTVEECLEELREMTPRRCEIVFATTGWLRIVVYANSIIPLELLLVSHPSLSACMAQVRKWHSEQKEQQG